jgi:hypothetical protein
MEEKAPECSLFSVRDSIKSEKSHAEKIGGICQWQNFEWQSGPSSQVT